MSNIIIASVRVFQLIVRIIGSVSYFSTAADPWVFLEREIKTFILNAMDPKEIETMIENGMSGSTVNVEGDGTHFDAVIVSEDFEGKTLLERHKLVYSVLGEAMKERIHALSLKTYTPEQWEKLR